MSAVCRIKRPHHILITGASSGIGEATAYEFAKHGARLVLVARRAERLAEIAELCSKDHGAEVQCIEADVRNESKITSLLHENIGDRSVDVLVNNAGRSIRRAIEASYDRFHDFERTMQLNYFGCLRLTMGFLPSMIAKKSGLVINISSIGVLTNAPRFSAYVASKAALEAWTRCASSELADRGIKFTTINMPLVRTPMIAPTKLYQNVPTLSPEDAADMIAEAIVYKPVRIATRVGIFGQALHTLMPRLAQTVLNTTFRMFPDSSASQGTTDKKAPAMSADQIAMQQLLRGVHF